MTHPTDTAKSDELKACPMCGGEGMVGATLDDFFYAMCAKDDCIRFDHYWSTEAEAIAAWNRRSSPPQNDAGGEGLTDAQILKIASNPICSPCSPWWLKDDVLLSDVRQAAVVFARAIIAALRTPMSELQALGQEFEAGEKECLLSPDGKHQVDTSMESGPNNCFHCEQPMPKTGARR